MLAFYITLSLDPIPSQLSPVFHFIAESMFNVVILSVLLYLDLEVSSPNKIYQRISHLSQLCYITRPSDPPLFDHLHNTRCSAVAVEVLIT
jgi:hypothetical protein